MKQDIIKKFDIIGKITLHNLDAAWLIRTLYGEMKINLYSSTWEDDFKQSHREMFPLDLADANTWSTFENCASVVIENATTDGKVTTCVVEIYNGDNMTGERTNLRWYATFDFPKTQLHNFSDVIDYKFDLHLEKLWQKEFEEKKEKEKLVISKVILSK